MARKYFARANTSSGCINLIENNLSGMNVCSIGGRSKSAKSKLMKTAAGYFEAKGMKAEYIVSPFDIKRYDAVIIRDVKFAMADSELLGKNPDTDTDSCLRIRSLEISEDYMEELEKRADCGYEGLYNAYGRAKQIHDEWEKIYIDNMDFERMNLYSTETIGRIIKTGVESRAGTRMERFFGASTMDGSVNYIDNLTEGLERRYFIKGRPGTGKSTFLKKLAKAAETAGYDTEVYYCSFDKNSLDMVLVPELGMCVFDSTAPHEMFPNRENDEILDFYTEAGLIGVDEKFEKQLEHIKRKYSFRIFEGMANLRLASGFDMEREYYLERITDCDELARTADKLVRRVM